jgi:hypothetical protein
MSNPTINEKGHKRWENHKGFHREDGPAIEYKNGTKSWFINGKYIYTLHTDGSTWKGDMRNIPKVTKQSIIAETLKLHL